MLAGYLGVDEDLMDVVFTKEERARMEQILKDQGSGVITKFVLPTELLPTDVLVEWHNRKMVRIEIKTLIKRACSSRNVHINGACYDRSIPVEVLL